MSKVTQEGLNLAAASNANDAVRKTENDASLALKVNTSLLGANNGVATLDSGGKVPLAQIPTSITGGLNYKGTWDASTNTPTLADGGVGGVQGDYYKVSVAGTTSIDGNAVWHVGDLIINDGTQWDKIDNFEAVVSVNGQTGAVVLTTDNIAEGVTNLYYTTARAKADAVVNSLGGSQTDQAPSVAAVNAALAAKAAAFSRGQEDLTLNGTDITNGYKDLAQTILANSLTVSVQSWGGLVQTAGVDYTLSTVAGKTRVTFAGDMTSLVSGNVLQASYQY